MRFGEILRKRPLISALVAGLLMAFSVIGWRRMTEPRYEGRGVREWVELLADDRTNFDAERAMGHFGERGVPYLVEAISRPWRWEKKLRKKFPGGTAFFLGGEKKLLTLKYRAMRALEELGGRETESRLGPRAVADKAVPALTRLLQKSDPSDVLPLMRLLTAFGTQASNAVPFMVNYLRSNTNDIPSKAELLYRICGRERVRSPELARFCFEYLEGDGAPALRDSAALCFIQNGYVDSKIEEQLLAGLNSKSKTSALSFRLMWLVGLSPLKSLDVVREDGWVPDEVYFQQIIYPVLCWRSNRSDKQALEQIRDVLRLPRHPDLRLTAIRLLECDGTAAKEFVPDLIPVLDDEVRPMLQNGAAKALRAIDPEVAEREIAKRYE
jgi:hypothetical protein